MSSLKYLRSKFNFVTSFGRDRVLEVWERKHNFVFIYFQNLSQKTIVYKSKSGMLNWKNSDSVLVIICIYFGSVLVTIFLHFGEGFSLVMVFKCIDLIFLFGYNIDEENPKNLVFGTHLCFYTTSYEVKREIILLKNDSFSHNWWGILLKYDFSHEM